jgi:hypothetical protein
VTEPIQLDLEEALRRRDEALDRVEEQLPRFLDDARGTALRLAERFGTVTADDVREAFAEQGIPGPSHFNSWGAVFRDDRFEWTGEYRRSANVKGKGNMQRVWRLAQ